MRQRFLILLPLTLAATAAHAGPYTMTRHVLTGGGTSLAGGSYALRGGPGQPFIAPSSGGLHVLQSGFWALPGATPTAIDELPAPTVTRLLHSAPNPFQSRTEIAFELAAPQHASLEVFDVTGARVRTLASGPFEAGRHQIAWDGRRDGGDTAPAGVYWLRFVSGAQRAHRRLVRLP
jgi:FlgD Ig-like domain